MLTAEKLVHVLLANQIGGILVRVHPSFMLRDNIQTCDNKHDLQDWLNTLKVMDAGSFQVQRDNFIEWPTVRGAMLLLTDVLDVVHKPQRTTLNAAGAKKT